MRLGIDLPSRVARALLCIVLIQAWVGGASWAADPAAAASPPAVATLPAAPADAAAIAAELDRSFAALAAADADLPRDTFDPAAIISAVGKEPATLLNWVRDQTFWAPYRGVLRGATGVLMDRVGSSADRAMLLAQLLREAGQEVRLARATLPEPMAATLLAKVRPIPHDRMQAARTPAPPLKMQAAADAFATKYVRPFGVDEARARHSFADATLTSDRLAEEMVQRSAEQTPALVEAIGERDAAGNAADEGQARAAALAAIADHWWAQCQTEGKWVDLDPLLPDAAPGTSAAATVAATFVPFVAKTGASVLDGKPCHEVGISVIVERWDAGALSEQTVLSHTFRSAEAVGQSIRLDHMPMNWPSAMSPTASDAGEQIQKAATDEKTWAPC